MTRSLMFCALVALIVEPQFAFSQVRNIRTIDGTENNQRNPDWGSAGIQLLRKIPAAYPGDGSGETMLSDSERANPREISNKLAAQTASNPNRRKLSDFAWQWGQFLDHDIDLSHTSEDAGSYFIPVAGADPLAPGIPFTRSEYNSSTGTTGNPRQQINSITAFIDASNVYGSDQETADSLREFSEGKLKTSADGKLLPVGEDGSFLAGDVRANEQVGLTAMHTLFVREHNRLAAKITKTYPQLNDEQIYQMARKIVGAEMQIITYNEFLPALLGLYAPSPFGGRKYNPKVDPSITNEFSTAFYRFGHSMLSSSLLLVDSSGETVDTIALLDSFFNPSYYQEDPERVDLILRGLATQTAQEIDNQIVDDVRNFLFGPPGAGGLDLATLNIQRGRDHGLPDYNSMRRAYGLRPVKDFKSINPDPNVYLALEDLYESVDNIDAWVGGLAEDHGHRNMSVGPLVAASMRDQFERLRTGDRFYWQRDREIRSSAIRRICNVRTVTLASVIEANSSIRGLPRNVFFTEKTRLHPFPKKTRQRKEKPKSPEFKKRPTIE